MRPAMPTGLQFGRPLALRCCDIRTKGRAMEWITEPDEDDESLTQQVLMLPADAPLQPALVEFWKRILADGYAHAASGWQSLGIEICERQSEDDDTGYMRAAFHDGQNGKSEHLGHHVLRSDAFTCIENPDDDRKTQAK